MVRLVAAGLSNEEIARELFISPLTAKTHVTRAIAKVGVRDRVQLVILAYSSGPSLSAARSVAWGCGVGTPTEPAASDYGLCWSTPKPLHCLPPLMQWRHQRGLAAARPSRS